MIKMDVNNHHIFVDHDCKNKNEEEIVFELVRAIDIICADSYVNDHLLSNEEKISKAIQKRNSILDKMKNIKYSCEEYIQD